MEGAKATEQSQTTLNGKNHDSETTDASATNTTSELPIGKRKEGSKRKYVTEITNDSNGKQNESSTKGLTTNNGHTASIGTNQPSPIPSTTTSPISNVNVKIVDEDTPSHGSGKRKKGANTDAPSRYDSSLGLLTQKFMDLVRKSKQGDLDLNEASRILSVQKRRIYDITNVLEGVGLIEKKSKNHILWKGSGTLNTDDQSKSDTAKVEIERLRKEELVIEEELRLAQNNLRLLTEGELFARSAFVTHDDIRNLPSMQGQTLIAIKAPAGTRLEVPDPDEGMTGSARRYQIYLQSETGTPIDVYLVSQETQDMGESMLNHQEPHLESVLGDAPLILSPSSIRTRPPMSPEPVQDTNTGFLKIGSPQRQLDTDYYLNNMYNTEGISDFYGTEDILI